MKLLFDENLSFRLVAAVTDIFPESQHVRDAGLLGAEDRESWEFAAQQDFVLVSKHRRCRSDLPACTRLTMRCNAPGDHVTVAIHASCGPTS
jgi:predicted nuclease of predicted toxin-antitoxin system